MMRSVLTCCSGLRTSGLPALPTEKAAVDTNNLHNSMLYQRMSPGPGQLQPLWISMSGLFWSILMWDRNRKHLHWLRGKYQLTSIQCSVQGPAMSWGTAAEHKASVWLTEPENSHLSSSQRLHSLTVHFRVHSSLSEPLLDKPQLTSGPFGFDLCWLYFEALLILSVTAAIN